MAIKGKHVPVKLGLLGDPFTQQYCELLKLPELFGDMILGCGVVLRCSAPPHCLLDNPYSYQLNATGGTEPYNYTVVSGTLPTGLNLNNSTGEVSGTPTIDQQIENVTFGVEDADSDSSQCSVTFYVSAKLAITTTTLPDANVGVAYSQQLAADGGNLPLTWAVISGSLPAGLTLSSGGLISGTTSNPGTYNFTVRTTDAGVQTDDQAYTLNVSAQVLPLFAWNPSETAQLLPEQTGTTRASGAAVTDHEGIIRQALDGEQRFKNARRVENLVITSSEDITVSAWQKTFATADSPTLLTFNQQFGSLLQSLETVEGKTYIVTADIRNISNNANIQFRHVNSATGSSQPITIDGTQKRYSTQFLGRTGGGVVSVGVNDTNAAGHGQIEITNILIEESTGRADVTTPSSYVSVGVFRENVLQYSNDFTQSYWINDSTAIYVGPVVGPDGSTAHEFTLDPSPNDFVRHFVTSSEIGGPTDYVCAVYVRQGATNSATHARLTTNAGGWNTGESKKVALTSEWQRITDVKITSIDSGTNRASYMVTSRDEAGVSDPDCLGNVQISFAQFELGDISTDRIYTNGAPGRDYGNGMGINGVDGVRYFPTTNGNTVADGTQGQPELVTNGDFATDTSGWTAARDATFANSPIGLIRVEETITNSPQAYQELTLVSGNTYVLEYIAGPKSSGGGDHEIRVSDNINTGSVFSQIVSANSRGKIQFTADANTQYVSLFAIASTGAGEYCDFDLISVKRYIAGSDTGIVTPGVGTPLPNIAALQEPAATNICTNSNPDTNWTVAQASITEDAAIAPDGTATASLINGTTDNTDHGIYESNTTDFVINDDYVVSTYVKKGTMQYVSLRGESSVVSPPRYPHICFDFDSESIDANDQVNDSGYEYAGNGWYRIWLTWTSAIASTGNSVVALSNVSTAPDSLEAIGNSWPGTTDDSVYVWGQQVESGTVPTSALKTEGTAVSRATDTPITSALTTPQTEGMAIYIAPEALQQVASGSTAIIGFDAVTATQGLMYRATGSQNVRSNDGVTTINTGNILTTTDAIAVRWGSGVFEIGRRTAGAWVWSGEAVYDGDFISDDLVALAVSIKDIYKYAETSIYDVDLGTSWIESNYP